jgi:signal transduction histidine kinase
VVGDAKRGAFGLSFLARAAVRGFERPQRRRLWLDSATDAPRFPHDAQEPLIPQAIARWFAPPTLPHPDLRRHARALWIVSWPFFAVVAVVLGIAVLVEPQTLARRSVTVASVGALIAFLHAISRAGRPVLASWILVIGLTVIVTQRAWITGGIHAPVAVFYVLFIVMASVLIGARGGLVTAGVSLAGAIVLTVGTAFQWLQPRPGAGSVLGGFVFVVLAIGLALVIQVLVTTRPPRSPMGEDAVHMLVHDMRTPMQVVMAHLQLLRYGTRDADLKNIDAALGGANTLNRMTNTLLDVSRLEAGHMPVQRFATDLSQVAASVVSGVRVLQPTRTITVETVGDPLCTCDPDLTRRIVENLVTNAMKHTEIQGLVSVRVIGSRDTVSVSVSDEGPGVSAERRGRIFTVYSAEGRQAVSGWESSGLGLAFCKLAAEAQGGTIRLEEGVSRGSMFVVELPR